MSTIGEYRFSHPSISLRWAGTTHAGMRRTVNEDSVFASFPVFVVADGMGGHAAGDVASALHSLYVDYLVVPILDPCSFPFACPRLQLPQTEQRSHGLPATG